MLMLEFLLQCVEDFLLQIVKIEKLKTLNFEKTFYKAA